MKIKRVTKLLLFLFLLVYSTIITAQFNNGIAIYKKILNDTTVLNINKNVNIRKILANTNTLAESLEYELKFSASEATFEVIEPLEFEDKMSLAMAILAGSGNGMRYTNLSTKESLHQKNAYGEQFLITNSLDSIAWKLTNESKQISGYTCYKAVTSKTVVGMKEVFEHPVIAWYTPSIPVNFGPIGYAGLPGLILELKFNVYTFYMTKIELGKKVNLKTPKKGRKITTFKFENLEKELSGQARRNFLKN